MSHMKSPWTTLSTRKLYASEHLSLFEDTVIKPDGTNGIYSYVKAPSFVLILAAESSKLLFVRLYRYNLQRWQLELPGGCIDENETPLEAAKRELLEETGRTAQKWTPLGVISGTSDAHVYLAETLTEQDTKEMAEEGIVECLGLSNKDIRQAITDGDFTDMKSLAALHLLHAHKQNVEK